MRDRRDDRQLHLSPQTRHDARTNKVVVVKKDRSVVDLGNIRSSRHGANVLERVIREGFTRKK